MVIDPKLVTLRALNVREAFLLILAFGRDQKATGFAGGRLLACE